MLIAIQQIWMSAEGRLKDWVRLAKTQIAAPMFIMV